MVGFSQKYKAKVFPGFDRQANLVLISQYSNSNFPGICENYLLMEGFNVLSESVASKNKKRIAVLSKRTEIKSYKFFISYI